MATYSTGITCTFGAVTFREVSDLSWQYGGALPSGRSTKWTADKGSLSLSCLDATGVATSKYGDREQLTVSGGGSDLTHYAVYESVSVAPELNGVTRYTVTFKLVD